MSEIEALMAPLLAEAERTGKWLYCGYQSLWFSPRQLREAQANGKFRWGPVNWKMRDPRERLEEAKRNLAVAQDEVARISWEIDSERAAARVVR